MLKVANHRRRSLAIGLLAGALTIPAIVAAAAPLIAFDIPAGSLDIALKRFASETHQQLLYSAASVAGRSVPGLSGRYSADDALQRLLNGSDILVEHAGPSVLVLKTRPNGTALNRASAVGGPLAAKDPDDPQLTVAGAPTTEGDHGQAERPPAEIVVTGTHIRGVKASASPMVDISREDMAREGDATVADALVKLTQNFNGTSNPVSTANGSDKTGTNASYGQGVNLRGLGSNATLVLINGRRMAGTGNLGDFADVSAVPSAAVDHVEVLLDGASAIYGSDAVGGVVNIITRKNYEGADSSIRIGDDEGGGGASILATQAFGFQWDGGRALLTYEYQHTDRLPTSSRTYTANSDLVPLGGTNHDIIESSPGNILALNATFTAYVPAYAIPDGSGLGLTPASFIAGGVNYQSLWHNADILPESDRNGFYLEASQDLDPKTTIDIESRFDIRHFTARSISSDGIIEVTNKNPFFVSPNGSTSELIGYSLAQAVGPQVNAGDDRNYDLSVGLKRDLWGDWRLDAYAGLEGDVGRTFSRNAINTSNFAEALGTTPDNPATSFSTAKDGFYNPYGSGLSNSAALRAFVSSGYDNDTNVSLIDVASVQVDGSIWDLPGGTIKGAFGVQFRHEHFEPTQASVTSSTPFLEGGTAYERDVTSGFGELNIPIVGPANALPFVKALNLSLAGRVEHYDDVGTTANPKVGLQWRPMDDVTVRATYGTSFRAPNLAELDQPVLYYPASLTAAGKSVLALLQTGGNPGLKPESATTWTAGLDWAPKAVAGLRLGVTWFDINFTNEIAAPGDLYTATVLSTPGLASLVRLLNPANSADLAAVNSILAKPSASYATAFPAAAYGAIVNAGYLNTASKQVRGYDLNASYAFDWLGYKLGLSGSGTYLDTFSQTQVAGGASQSLLDTPGQPANFRARGAIDVGRGPYQATFIVNYVNAYKDPVDGRTIGSWTTFDATVSWRSPASTGPLKGVMVSASAQNLFDTDPPFYDSPQGIGYDPANANPFGRMVSLQLNKRW